jgi:7-cyano-7-deazaguanine synthase in queuosine biosynthesis
MKTLVLFSGGYDCTAVLYKLLTETDDGIHAYHLAWTLGERGDNRAETDAVKNIIPWLYRNTRPFTFHSDTLAASTGCGHAPFIYAGLMLGVYSIAKAAEWRRVIMGSVGPQTPASHTRNAVAEAVCSAVMEGRQVPPPWEFPFQTPEYSKARMIGAIPDDLREMCWTCMRPVQVGDSFVPCGQCAKCAELDQAVQEMTNG